MLSSVFCFTYIHSNRTVFYFLKAFPPRSGIPQGLPSKNTASAARMIISRQPARRAALPGFSGHGATFAGRNEMPLSPYPVFTVSYCQENPF